MKPKELRKQIRNVLQEVGKDFLLSDLGTELNAKINERLDSIEAFCSEQLTKQDKRARDIQSFLLQEVNGKIKRDLFNANVTVDSIVAVLSEAGLNIPDFDKKVDEKKLEISKKLEAEAIEKMQAQLKTLSEQKPEQKQESNEEQK